MYVVFQSFRLIVIQSSFIKSQQDAATPDTRIWGPFWVRQSGRSFASKSNMALNWPITGEPVSAESQPKSYDWEH